MAEEGGLSDAQLRLKYMEIYGMPSPPITSTTRKFILKKISNPNITGKPAPVEEDEGDDEPDVPPHPPTRIPKRLGRSALASMNQQADRSISPELTAKSPAESLRPQRQKSLGRLPDLVDDGEPDENTQPARKVTPARRTQELKSPLPTNVRGFTPSDPNPITVRRSIDRSPCNSIGGYSSTIQSPLSHVGNDTFRSRLAGTDNTPYQSDFVRRLSESTRRSQLVNEDERISDDEGAIGSPVKIVGGNTGGYQVESGSSSGFFSIALIFALLVPFTILVGALALFYNTPKAEFDNTLRFPLCQGSSVDIPGISCIDEVHRAAVESLYSAFASGLADIHSGAPCTTNHNQPIFIDNNSVKEMIITLDDKISMYIVNLELQNLKVLVDSNPFLGLRSKTDGIQLVKGPDTVVCFLWSKMVLLAEWIIKIVVISTLALTLFFGVRWHLAKQARHREEVMTAADKVIDLAKSRMFLPVDQAGKDLTSCGYSVGIINDAINKAVDDSLLRLEVRNNVKGIVYVGGSTFNSISDSAWTSAPYAADAGTYFLPPSSCLKIRGMFTPANKIMSNDDVTKIVDAILERSIGNRIVHVVVDRKSPDGIVYLRGLMKADASGVFRRLNNSCYNGHPISVKYVRDERYEDKFPNSHSYTRPLRPSSQTNQ